MFTIYMYVFVLIEVIFCNLFFKLEMHVSHFICETLFAIAIKSSTSAAGSLTGETTPGHWKEGFFPLAPKVTKWMNNKLKTNTVSRVFCNTF